MSITPKGMSIQEAYRIYREGKLIVNRKYQRKLVWTNDEKEKLIDSIMRSYPIPLILLAERPEQHGHGFYEILDGVQRLTAIFDFIENRTTFGGYYFDTEEFTRAKAHAKLNIFTAASREGNHFFVPEDCAKFLDYQLAVTIYPAMEESEMIDVFGRINSQGRQLSNQERRQAGVINIFSELVRKISYEIRGDASRNLLKLYEMPSISIDDYRHNMNYAIKAEDIFWCKSGVLGKNELRDGEDEEMMADILASILLEEPFPRSREEFDKLYEESSETFRGILNALARVDIEILYSNVVDTFSVLREVIESVDNSINGFRKIVSGQHRNPVKNSFYSLFMAFYDLLVIQEMSPDNYQGIVKSIEGLQTRLINSAKYAKVQDRIENIDITKALIHRNFVKREPTALRHGPGLAIDFENSLRRSKIETARYEFKQGIFRLSDKPTLDESLIVRICETATAIANSAQGVDGFIYIGVADDLKDAERSKTVYEKDFLTKHDKYIVGIDREITFQGWNFDQYMRVFMDRVRKSMIDEPLKSQLLSQIDVVEYKGYSIIRIRIPVQNNITLFGDKVFVRNNNDTKLIENPKEILALSAQFGK